MLVLCALPSYAMFKVWAQTPKPTVIWEQKYIKSFCETAIWEKTYIKSSSKATILEQKYTKSLSETAIVEKQYKNHDAKLLLRNKSI